MEVLFYRGKSWISKAIRWQTRSIHSHAALGLDNGQIIEAWTGGVREMPTPFDEHTNGTPIDVCRYFHGYDPRGESHAAEEAVWLWAKEQVGKKYDFRMLFRFLPRLPETPDTKDKWFCSELVAEGYRLNGLPLLERIPSAYIHPGMLFTSPRLEYKYSLMQKDGKITTWKEAKWLG